MAFPEKDNAANEWRLSKLNHLCRIPGTWNWKLGLFIVWNIGVAITLILLCVLLAHYPIAVEKKLYASEQRTGKMLDMIQQMQSTDHEKISVIEGEQDEFAKNLGELRGQQESVQEMLNETLTKQEETHAELQGKHEAFQEMLNEMQAKQEERLAELQAKQGALQETLGKTIQEQEKMQTELQIKQDRFDEMLHILEKKLVKLNPPRADSRSTHSGASGKYLSYFLIYFLSVSLRFI